MVFHGSIAIFFAGDFWAIFFRWIFLISIGNLKFADARRNSGAAAAPFEYEYTSYSINSGANGGENKFGQSRSKSASSSSSSSTFLNGQYNSNNRENSYDRKHPLSPENYGKFYGDKKVNVANTNYVSDGRFAIDGPWKHLDLAKGHIFQYCYSCASEVFGAAYKLSYQDIFREPLSITNDCDGYPNFKETQIAYKNCSIGCLSVRDTLKIGGKHARSWYRGCLDDMINYDKQQLDNIRSQSCTYLDFSKLFGHPDREGRIYLCACHGRLCNHGLRSSNAGLFITSLAILVPFITSLVSFSACD